MATIVMAMVMAMVMVMVMMTMVAGSPTIITLSLALPRSLSWAGSQAGFDRIDGSAPVCRCRRVKKGERGKKKRRKKTPKMSVDRLKGASTCDGCVRVEKRWKEGKRADSRTRECVNQRECARESVASTRNADPGKQQKRRRERAGRADSQQLRQGFGRQERQSRAGSRLGQ